MTCRRLLHSYDTRRTAEKRKAANWLPLRRLPTRGVLTLFETQTETRECLYRSHNPAGWLETATRRLSEARHSGETARRYAAERDRPDRMSDSVLFLDGDPATATANGP